MEGIIEEFQQAVDRAGVLRALAHPVRLCIVRGLLRSGECNVQKMQSCLRAPQSTVSQHLARLRAAHIIEGRRSGVEILYHVISEEAKRVIYALFPEDRSTSSPTSI